MNNKETPESSTEKISSDSRSMQIGESIIIPGVKLRHILKGHTSAVYRMALSPDGRAHWHRLLRLGMEQSDLGYGKW